MDEKIFGVRELLGKVYRKIATDFEIGGGITVRGEIAGFKIHGKHAYFSLKDEETLLKCVFFAYASLSDSEIAAGTVVDIHGQLKIYEPRGDLQFYANRIEILSEKGMLRIKYEKIKKMLLAEGIIPRPEYERRRLPEYPRKIAVIASRTSAALQDVIKTLNLRNPTVKVELHHTAVQGEKAHIQIINALEKAECGSADIIVMVRGGGSPEDLWCFNEEALVRKVRSCSKPIIVGVGHETDHSLAEYAADVIASTPTAAAVMAGLPISELLKSKTYRLKVLAEKLKKEIFHSKKILELQKASVSRQHPMEVLNAKKRKLEDSMRQLENSVNSVVLKKSTVLANMKALIGALSPIGCLETTKAEFDGKIRQLVQLNPLNTILRGYSWVESDGRIMESVSETKTGDKIVIVMRDGNITAVVENVDKIHKSERIGLDEKEF